MTDPGHRNRMQMYTLVRLLLEKIMYGIQEPIYIRTEIYRTNLQTRTPTATYQLKLLQANPPSPSHNTKRGI